MAFRTSESRYKKQLMLRWVYLLWRYMLRTILVVLGVLLVILILLFGVIQVPQTHRYVADIAENRFNSVYFGELSIGNLSGFIPFNMEVRDVLLYGAPREDGELADTLIYIQRGEVRLNPFDFFRNDISIQALTIENPFVDVTLESDENTYKLANAFKRRDQLEESNRIMFRDFQILAPFFSVRDGEINLQFRRDAQLTQSPVHEIREIQLSAFAEISSIQRYFDLQFLFFDIPSKSIDPYQLRGQIFNDDRFIEFNAVRFRHADSRVNVSGEIAGVNILEENLDEQFRNATYSLSIDTTRINPADFVTLDSYDPRFESVLEIDIKIGGTLERMGIDRSDILYGNSRFSMVGEVGNLHQIENLTYDVNLRNVRLYERDIAAFLNNNGSLDFPDLDKLRFSGRLFGDLNRTDGDFNIRTDRGRIQLAGDIQWLDQPDYQFTINTHELDLAQFDAYAIPSTKLNSTSILKGVGFERESAFIEGDIKIYNSVINDFPVEEFNFLGMYSDEVLSSDIFLFKNGSTFQGELALNTSANKSLRIDGSAQGFRLHDYYETNHIADSNLDFDLNVFVFGNDINDVSGQFSLDIKNAIIGEDTLGVHQFYADLSTLQNGSRELRFTSTIFDLGMRGDVYPQQIADMALYWYDYVENRVDEAFLFEDIEDLESESQTRPLNLDVDITVKDLSYLSAYLPNIPELKADLAGDVQIQADNQRILVSGGFAGRQVGADDALLESFSAQFTTNLQYRYRLQEFSAIDFVLAANALTYGRVNVSSINASYSMLNENISIITSIQDIGEENYGLDLRLNAVVSDTSLNFLVEQFSLGNPQYKWFNDGSPRLTLNDQEKLHIEHFILRNGNETIDIYGTLSSDLADSVDYRLDNVDLAKLSSLIEGRLNFQGILDGSFSTRSLLKEPSISGELYVDNFALNERVLGDLIFSSAFNPERERFDTKLVVKADTAKHASVLPKDRPVYSDVEISGWLSAPGSTSQSDTSYFFDVIINEIDGWVLTPILPDIFVRTEGSASGAGVFFGNFDDFNFNAEFDVKEIRAVPQFLLTNYTLSGRVVLDRFDGVLIDNVLVSDRRGGSGRLRGTVGFNDFLPERPLDLTLDLSRLEFLNNSYEQDIPFYGNVSGTGSVSLTGSNLSPFLRTIRPVTTTTDSRLYIPLLDETSVEEQARFIEFVKSFSDFEQRRTSQQETTTVEPIADLSFLEIFRLDLQFISPIGSNVQLVFDPLTGEVLNTRGSGRVRITLEDEVLQMFGNFAVSDGEYTFVGGDIFVRRFQLRDGGTINWEGDPANARLNIIAAYRARPNIGVLTGGIIDQQSRIPVDLMLEITGTIESIENNFYFEFPNAIDVSQNATELALLNSEDQKLIQATSLLFTGGFIPVGNAAEGQAGDLGSSLQSRAGQVGLSQLLSNQINAVLNSNLSLLDIDLNLTGFDQADLGVALRLFDDRLILRGESQFYSGAETGNETMIGDLGVTYRINRSLSLEVFHRRDPTLRSIVGNQTQAESIKGIGLEAQLQFNTFKELRERIWVNIRRIFGYNEEENE
jgi:translocation and assembly module TamB